MLVRRFRECASGNVAMLFGLSLLPMIGMLGLAVDYSMAAQQRTRLQSAIDSTALSVAHLDPKLTQAQLNQKANEIFDQNFKTTDGVASNPVTVVRGKDYVQVTASASVDTTFMRVMKVDKVDVASSGKVVWGSSKVEVVLALDNTGSMSGTKLTELKAAAKNMVDLLAAQSYEAGSVKIGLVPFATSVRVSKSTYKDAEWIRFDDVHYTDRVCNNNGNNCRNEDRTRAFDKSVWKGCIQDRDQTPNGYDVMDIINPGPAAPGTPTPYDQQVGYRTTDTTTLYPAVEVCPSSEQNLATVVPLTDMSQSANVTALKDAITAMNAAGMTNVTIGVSWGMALLSNKAPFTEGAVSGGTAPGEAVQKILIVLTDGLNTENRFDDADDDIDARTKLACANAKKIGTTFTVRLIAGSEALLKECASAPDNYHSVKKASELTDVFGDIVNAINALRLAS